MTRRGYVIVTTLAAFGVVITSVVSMSPRLVWNASASTPIGLYLIASAGPLVGGDLAALLPPEPVTRFMVQRGYVGEGVPLLKHIAARPGQVVCRCGRSIKVDGVQIGEALYRDRHDRALPDWQGCRRLSDGEVFVLNRNVRDSFDGRYFGPMPASTVIGRAIPLFIDERGDGHFIWRPTMH
ncbi:S26 family signal peptidase [Labrys sp. WJW]|uniref:S26 family signal peptidase n=1 Tax=Labrys sp. WJW TaxID=1737983 RepID=UPI00082BBA3A|nr:S26 family signal peptidase [Labrys sp. WJW]OCC05397.1 S26 family signal peptidase [Labrys sp. WJW]